MSGQCRLSVFIEVLQPALTDAHDRRRRVAFRRFDRHHRTDELAVLLASLDRTALVHVPIGKVSFNEQALEENLATIVSEIVKAKPSGSKGVYIKTITLTTTMGPGIPLDPTPTLAMRTS